MSIFLPPPRPTSTFFVIAVTSFGTVSARLVPDSCSLICDFSERTNICWRASR